MANELWLKRHIEKCTVTRVLILILRRRRFGNGMAWNTKQTNKQTNKQNGISEQWNISVKEFSMK